MHLKETMLKAALRGVLESVKLHFTHVGFRDPLNYHVDYNCCLVRNRHALEFERQLHKFEEGERSLLLAAYHAIQQICIIRTNISLFKGLIYRLHYLIRKSSSNP